MRRTRCATKTPASGLSKRLAPKLPKPAPTPPKPGSARKAGEDRQRILIYGPQFGAQLGYVIDYGDGSQHRAAEGFHGDWIITHWMPLPAPPITKESQP